MKDGVCSLVTTNIGEIPEDELDVEVTQTDSGDVWVMARECKYRGTAHPEAIGEVVRRDVWVTMKQGQAAQAASEL